MKKCGMGKRAKGASGDGKAEGAMKKPYSAKKTGKKTRKNGGAK